MSEFGILQLGTEQLLTIKSPIKEVRQRKLKLDIKLIKVSIKLKHLKDNLQLPKKRRYCTTFKS